MQVTKTVNSPTEVGLKISAGSDELEPIKTHVLNAHFADVKVPGFRAGRAPAELIEKSIDQRHFTDELIEHAINELYSRVINQEKLRPVGQPKIEIKKFVPYTTLEFEITQEIIGSVSLPSYKGIKLAKPKVTITADQVSNVLKSLQARLAARSEVSRPAKNGDELIIDFAGRDVKDEPVPGADGKDYALVLGSNSFIPGFEENLVGLKAGNDKEFAITFPKDYSVTPLQNQKVTFKVNVKKVNELVEPKVDDELAKKAGPFTSVAGLKADIKKQLQSERQWQTDRDHESQLIQKITEKAQVEIPPSLVEEQILRLEEDEKRNLSYRGQTWQEHLKAEGINQEQHHERHRSEATERVKAGLVLSEIALKEGLEVTPAEIDTRIEELRTQYQDPAMRAELDKPENRQDVAARILTEKTISKIVEYSSK